MDARDAFARRILDEHGQRLRRHLSMRGIPERDLDDLVQEILAAAWAGWESYDPERDLGAWVFAIASKQAAMFLRRPYVRNEHVGMTGEVVHEVADEMVDGRDGPEALRVQQDRRTMLDEMVASMTAAQREVVTAYELEEAPMADVAREKGITSGEAWSRWKAGMRRCQGWFQRWQAAERGKGRDGVPMAVVSCLSLREGIRRAWGRRRVEAPKGRAPRGGWVAVHGAAVKATVALLALGCMSPAGSALVCAAPTGMTERVAELSKRRVVAAAVAAEESTAAAEETAPAVEQTMPAVEQTAPAVVSDSNVKSSAPAVVPSAAAPPTSARASARLPRSPEALAHGAERDDADPATRMLLQAETEHQAGNDAEALGWLLDHGNRRTSGDVAARRNRLLREIVAR